MAVRRVQVAGFSGDGSVKAKAEGSEGGSQLAGGGEWKASKGMEKNGEGAAAATNRSGGAAPHGREREV